LGEKHGHAHMTASPDLMRHLTAQDWPGNVRQLRNTLERMVVFSPENTLDMHSLQPRSQTFSSPEIPSNLPPPSSSTIAPLQELEKKAILHALSVTGGNRTQAARRLGIGVRTLFRKLKTFSPEEMPEELRGENSTERMN